MAPKHLLLCILVSASGALTPIATHAQARLTDGSSTTVNGPDNIYEYQNKEITTPSHKSDTRIVDPVTTDTSEDTSISVLGSDSVKGILIAQAHRSLLTSVVQSLLVIADKESDHATEIRSIAESLKMSEATATNAIEKISSRSTLRSFFSGSDNTNLRLLKSEMKKIQDTVLRLKTINTELRRPHDDLFTVQTQTLEQDQLHIQDFVAAYENNHGFFSWLGGLFKTGHETYASNI